MMSERKPHEHFIKVFSFEDDTTRPGRVLSTAKIGDVYMSRIFIDPGVTLGNYYHKQTSVMFYVAYGTILGRFVQVHTDEKKEIRIEAGRHVVHLPVFTAFTLKNVGFDPALLVVFSNRRFNDGDDHPYSL